MVQDGQTDRDLGIAWVGGWEVDVVVVDVMGTLRRVPVALSPCRDTALMGAQCCCDLQTQDRTWPH